MATNVSLVPAEAEERLLPESDKAFRSKVYILDDTQAWVDKGAGFTHIKRDASPSSPSFELEVLSDSGTEVLVTIPVVAGDGDNFRHQQATIITWEHFGPPEREVALSFQESTGCLAVW